MHATVPNTLLLKVANLWSIKRNWSCGRTGNRLLDNFSLNRIANYPVKFYRCGNKYCGNGDYHSHSIDWYKQDWKLDGHYNDVMISAMASQITSLTIVYSPVYSGAYQRKHQSSTSLAFVWGIHRWPVNSPHKWPLTRKIFSFGDVIMIYFTSDVLRCSSWM